MDKLSSLRRSYEQATLNEGDVLGDPLEQFKSWLEDAIAHPDVVEANAMVVATVSESNLPATRVVLLKDIIEEGLVFYTNYNSRKGQDLASNPAIACNFWWQPLQRQVRIEGTVSRVSNAISDAYFASRPVGSRMGACASPQSQVIPDRGFLDDRLNALKADLRPDHGPARPPHWGGYMIRPHMFEFWQGRKNRLHDRLRFQRVDSTWTIDRLAP